MAAVDTETPTSESPADCDRSVDPRTVAVWRWSTLAAFAPAAAVLTVVAAALSLERLPAAPLVWVVWLLVLTAAAVAAWRYPPARYRHLGYRVDGTGITIRQGVVWRTQSSLPKVRIQHTDVSQGPLQRRYGVATLKLYTAGSRFTRTELPGLEHSEAVALRDRLQRQGHGDAV
ncbi:MAG: PH domain-containing protein [Gammaproteobacteria bacterium]|nr:PH domain-containing protein [Gammaproteobacteria bacterium]